MKSLNPYLEAVSTVIVAGRLCLCLLTILGHVAPVKAATTRSDLIVSESAEGSVKMANKNQFKVADQVRLRAGGPIMTIDSLLKEPEGPTVYYCVWFTDETKHRVGFTADKLVAAKPEKTP